MKMNLESAKTPAFKFYYKLHVCIIWCVLSFYSEGELPVYDIVEEKVSPVLCFCLIKTDQLRARENKQKNNHPNKCLNTMAG